MYKCPLTLCGWQDISRSVFLYLFQDKKNPRDWNRTCLLHHHTYHIVVDKNHANTSPERFPMGDDPCKLHRKRGDLMWHAVWLLLHGQKMQIAKAMLPNKQIWSWLSINSQSSLLVNNVPAFTQAGIMCCMTKFQPPGGSISLTCDTELTHHFTWSAALLKD